MGTTAPVWLARFAAELGVDPPTPEEIDVLLALAGHAAHASERTAAPVGCWLAARSGLTPDEALAAARRMAVPDAET
ncbi:MAG: DUF6457 domain-containing protein [Actinomycetota bacterium]|nr:DUF6457 domain-containing protein [Actinomycetota bacterium]MDA8340760.1 DUF6457 domain-containing protein [Actinomycetota bacterium]